MVRVEFDEKGSEWCNNRTKIPLQNGISEGGTTREINPVGRNVQNEEG